MGERIAVRRWRTMRYIQVTWCRGVLGATDGEGELAVRPPRAQKCAATRIFQIKKNYFMRPKIFILMNQINGNSIKKTQWFFFRGYYFLLEAAIVITCPGRQKTLLRHWPDDGTGAKACSEANVGSSGVEPWSFVPVMKLFTPTALFSIIPTQWNTGKGSEWCHEASAFSYNYCVTDPEWLQIMATVMSNLRV